MDRLVPVILAGGSGTRLWPLSREAYPKPFLHLFGDDKPSLFQMALASVEDRTHFTSPLIACNEMHYFHCLDQLDAVGVQAAHLIVEPVARNTAPAIAAAAYEAILRYGESAMLLILSADQLIQQTELFLEAVFIAHHFFDTIDDSRLATFGVMPRAPKTDYGYIHAGKALHPGVLQLQAFIEKPNAIDAANYIKTGEYYWNSGMFLFRAKTYLEELAMHAPAMHAAVREAYVQAHHLEQMHYPVRRLDRDAFTACPSDSIDYAVMEKTDRAVVLPFASTWHDLGSWDAVCEVSQPDADENVIQGEVAHLNTKNCLLSAEEGLIAAVGIQDQIIVRTRDAVLVAHKHCTQDIKNLVAQLKEREVSVATQHAKVFRPWGFYESLVSSALYQVKHLVVKPGASLSLQLHHHRTEHWVVVSGEAHVICGESTFTLHENESTYISKETKHRLSNKKTEPLHVIEVQCGSYLGEDDIIRFEDDYQRDENIVSSNVI
jgi:mannose-1-phosphate guanylyltransferase/mannose-6-phosphate isomerase